MDTAVPTMFFGVLNRYFNSLLNFVSNFFAADALFRLITPFTSNGINANNCRNFPNCPDGFILIEAKISMAAKSPIHIVII